MSYFRDNIGDCRGYVPGFQSQDPDILKLNSNENPFLPSAKVLEALSLVQLSDIRKYPDALAASFRQAAAKLHNLSASNILCTNGGDDLLTIVFRAFCDKDRPVAYPVPTYSLYSILAKLQDCQAIEIPFDDEFNLPAKLSSAGAALTIICNPNAPSGSIINSEELSSLADELTGILLIDEAYVDFAGTDCISLVNDFDNVIILRSMSKGYSLAGIRFGYAIASPGLIDGMMKLKDSYNVNVFSIAAATAAISDQGYSQECWQKLNNQRDRLTKELRDLGFVVLESHSNFILAQKKEARSIYDKLADQNIFVRYFDLPQLEDKIRISIGTAAQNDKLLEAIKNILSEGK